VAAVIVDPEKRKIRYAAQNTLTAMHDGEMKRLAARQQAAEHQVRMPSILRSALSRLPSSPAGSVLP